MKAILFLHALFCLSAAQLTCNTSCAVSSFVDDSAPHYNEEEAIRVVLCSKSCDNNESCVNDCLQQSHMWTRATHSSNEIVSPPVVVLYNSSAVYTVELPIPYINLMDGALLKVESSDLANTTTFFPLKPVRTTEVSLASFVCSRVIVSFAIINSSVVSGYSAATELCVHQALPGSATKVGVSFKLDPTLPGHAILNVTWEAPISGDLEFYVLNVAANDTRNGCVEQLPLNVTIQPQALSYVVQAQKDKDLPMIGCNYSLYILSIPGHYASFTYFSIPEAETYNVSFTGSMAVPNHNPTSALSSSLLQTFYLSSTKDIASSGQNTLISTPSPSGLESIGPSQSSSGNILSPNSFVATPIQNLFPSIVFSNASQTSRITMDSSIPNSALHVPNTILRSTSMYMYGLTQGYLDAPSPTPNIMEVPNIAEKNNILSNLMDDPVPLSSVNVTASLVTETTLPNPLSLVSILPSPTNFILMTTLIPIMTSTFDTSKLASKSSPTDVPVSLSTSAFTPTPSSNILAITITPTPSLPSPVVAPTSGLSIQCTLSFNPCNGLYDLVATWNVSADYFGTIELFFCEFTVQFLSLLRTDRIHIQNNQYQYSWIQYNNTPNSNMYNVKVSPLPYEKETSPPPVLLMPATCNFPTLVPVAPNPITQVNVTGLYLDAASGTISLTVTWKRGKYDNGVLRHYQLYIGSTPLLPTDKDQSTGSFWSNLIAPNVTQLSLTSISIPPAQSQLYIQMRASNQFLFSNWSKPLVLNLTNPSSTQTTSNLIESLPLPIFAFWVIGAGSSVIISFVFTLVCSCVFHKRHRRRFDYGTLFITGKRHTCRRAQELDDRSARLFDLQDTLLASTLTFDEWEVPRCEVTVMENEPLGKGFFGEVFRGEVTGLLRGSVSSLHSPVKASVAVKRLKRSASCAEKANFLKEIEMMKTVSQGESDFSMYVVNMVGCVTAQEPLLLLVEFVKYGDLLNYLRFVRKVTEDTPGRICSAIPYMEPKGVYSCLAPKEDLLAELGPVNDLDLLSFARQTAAGMEYLSSLSIVHRDLACRNILIGRNKLLKISDFGMSRVVMADEVYINTSHGRLPLRWMAVESIFQREFTIASDIWAYGIVLWELATMGGFPYASVSNKALTVQLKDGLRLEKPSNCFTDMYNVMLDCWHDNPNMRPKFSALRRTMEHFMATAAQNGSHSYFFEGHPQSSSYIYEQVPASCEGNTNANNTSEDIENQSVVIELHPPIEWLNVTTPCGCEVSNNGQASRRSVASSLHSVFSELECVEVRYVASPIHSVNSVHTSARQSALILPEHLSQDCQQDQDSRLSVQLGRELSKLTCSNNDSAGADGSPQVTGATLAQNMQ